MGSICQWLINVVRTDKPKRLIGLNQQVRGRLFGFPLPDTQTNGHRRTGQHLTHLEVSQWNVVSSSSFPQGKANRKASR